MKSDKKAKEYIKNKKIYPLLNTAYAEMWVVEGSTGMWEIRYDKEKDIYTCNCPNVKNVKCCHIKSIILWKQNKKE